METRSRKRSRLEAFEEDFDQLQAAILEGLSGHGTLEQVSEAVFQSVIRTSIVKQGLEVQHAWTKDHQEQLAFGLRQTLQVLTSHASAAEQPLMQYTVTGSNQPSVSMLLKAAIGLSQNKRISKDHAFQLFEDIVETGNIEEVKTAFKLVNQYWDVNDYWANPLPMQKACNQFTKRLSNDQDAEFLGTVLTLVAKILPFNSKAGINLMWNVNQHPVHMDDTVEPSVDGRDPIDEKLYRQLWDLQNAFQHPSSQSEPNAWAEMTTRVRAVLAKLKQEAIGVASTTTAVPQENGQSVIVKYLTSSKLTLLQLRDAAFRRTLLVQCLVLLHACAHPRQSAIKAATALKERQVTELQALQHQLYEELSRTPEQGQAFTDVMKTVLDRETAFVAWKSEGAPEYWQSQGQGLPTLSDSALSRALPKHVPKKQKSTSPKKEGMAAEQSSMPDTDVSRMWSNSGAEQDLYRHNRDPLLLPRTEAFLARIGEELVPDKVRQRNKYATAKALLMRDSAGKEHYGPDPVFLFRCQRALQRTDMALWETSTKLDQVGERLEVAFSELYPDKVPEGWEQPVIIETDSAQNAKTARPAAKGRAVKLAATPATSGAPEDEAGDKQVGDSTMTPADSVASPEALNNAVRDASKPQNPGEAVTNERAAGDAVMTDAQEPESAEAVNAVDAGAFASTVGDKADANSGVESVPTKAVDAQAVDDLVNLPLKEELGQVDDAQEQRSGTETNLQSSATKQADAAAPDQKASETNAADT